LFFNILIFIFGISIGWYIHIYFNYLKPPQKIFIEKNITKIEVVKEECREVKRVVYKIEEKKKDSFKDILNRDFNMALNIYLSADGKKKEEYSLILERYFLESSKNIILLKQLQELIKFDPNQDRFLLTLAKVYIDMDKLDMAIETLFELQGDIDIDKYLSKVIDRYIERLLKSRDFSKLLSFLEDIIDRDIDTQKYAIELSKVYIKLKDYKRATEVLKDNIDEDSIYYKSANKLIKDIKENPDNKYSHKVPLVKIGENQYGVDVRIDDIPIRLLIDTGATLTLVDSSFIAYNNISKDVILNTAGGLIVANSTYVLLEVNDIRFDNFKITTTPFSQNGINGLLGMDFLKHFDFKIDQDNNYLYLKEK